ncbi:MAG: fused MFS/spermidine synthase [Synergistaceae bacterium]|jgi:spermidine synthase/MFS family permease|nr:fused MFS/spermidine synthase [Synergistaceae bacterium]
MKNKQQKQPSEAQNQAQTQAAPAPRKKGVLEAASFLCGAAVMVLEMAGSRVVAPYLGTSLIVWTSLIGVIMASLSVGAQLGGILADRKPRTAVLAHIVMASACCVTACALAANIVLDALTGSRGSVGGIYVSSLIGAMVLFAPPSLLLGMVSPFITRLAMLDIGSSGTTVGRFSALSSAGSILGTFLGGFVLISLFASGVILLLTAGLLALVAFMLYHRGKAEGEPGAPGVFGGGAVTLLVLLAAAFGVTDARGMPAMPPGTHIDTSYNHLWIAEQTRPNGRRARYLMTAAAGEGAQSVIYTDKPDELVSDYTKFYDLAFCYKPDIKKVLMLGGGGYCVPRHLNATRDTVSVDVVELDPGITDAAIKYFNLRDGPNIRIFHEDARTFLNRADPSVRYDAVFVDVFGSWYTIPFHMATVEAAQRISDVMADDGVMISNVISSLRGPKSGVLSGIYAAMLKVFPKVLIFPATRPESQFAGARQNIMLVAFKNPSIAEDPESTRFATPEVQRLLSHMWRAPFVPSAEAFTDSFAPVERYTLME